VNNLLWECRGGEEKGGLRPPNVFRKNTKKKKKRTGGGRGGGGEVSKGIKSLWKGCAGRTKSARPQSKDEGKVGPWKNQSAGGDEVIRIFGERAKCAPGQS